jgi:3-hydroxyacyl-[acyl-carrier-protein] dehydratase
MRLEQFRMIDRVERLDRAAQTIACRCEVPRQSSVFEGHFPGHPLLPGTLMIEAIAQCCGLLVLALQDFARMPVLIGVDKARMRAMVAPGAVLAAEGRLVQEGSGYAAAAGRLLSEGRKVAEAEIRLGTIPFPSEQLRGEARGFAREIGLV